MDMKTRITAKEYKESMPEHVIQAHFIQSLLVEFGENGKKIVWFSIPNGTKSAWTNKRNKATGMIAGIPDMFIGYQGKSIFLEFKSTKGIVQQKQKEVHIMLNKNGFECFVVRSSEQALDVVKNWLSLFYD